jgi:hypothetical protein
VTDPVTGVSREAQADRIYRALGKFFVEFSRIIWAMEFSLSIVAGGNGEVVRAAVIEVTADPLTRVWRSAMVQSTNLSDQDLAVLAEIAKGISELINLRNDWAHGNWIVGFGARDTRDWSRAAISRFKNSAKGIASPSNLEIRPTAEYIEKAASHASVVSLAVFTYGLAGFALQQGHGAGTRPSERVHVVKLPGRRQIRVTEYGTDWHVSEWP